MGDETGLIVRSEIQVIADTAVRIDRLLAAAMQLISKLEATYATLSKIAMEKSEDDSRVGTGTGC